MALSLTTPFMLQLGFSKTDIGAVTKGFGLIATIVGSLIGGALIARIGMKRALLLFGLAGGISTLCFAVLAMVGKNYTVMTLSIAIENLCGGMSTAAFLAFLMGLCNKKFTATQYALLTSLAAVTRVFAGAPTGYFVEQMGWTTFFLICTLAAAPGVLMVAARFNKWVSQPIT